QTPDGLARLHGLEPLRDPRGVAAALDATAETVKFLAESAIGLRASDDLVAILASLPVEGRALEPRQLLTLAEVLASLAPTCQAIRRARGSYPVLRAIAARATSFESEIAAIRRTIDPGGDVFDDASPELRSIRDRLRKQRARLRGTLESYLRGKDTAK